MQFWRFLVITAVSAVWSAAVMAQALAGSVHNKSAGLSFNVPAGWQAQLGEQGYVLGSATQAGVLLILPHEYTSIAQLKQEAAAPMDDGAGTQLSFANVQEALAGRALAGAVSGLLQGQPVKGDVVALINDQGPGVMVLALAAIAQYDERFQRLAMELAGSIEFSKPDYGDIVSQWSESLRNARLAYLSSYYSSGSSYGGYSTGGGYSDREEIHLCGDGHFKYSSNSSMSIDTGGAFGHSHGSDAGHGRWEVTGDAAGRAVLRLVFHSGSVSEYQLAIEGGKTYLNGARYYRTYAGDGADMGPACP